MPPPRPERLEFTDCHGCGKRVATTASLCRHCNTERQVAPAVKKSPSARSGAPFTGRNEETELDADADSHAALAYGGYGEDDLDESQAEEKDPSSSGFSTRIKALWWYVALILLIFFLISALLPQIW